MKARQRSTSQRWATIGVGVIAALALWVGFAALQGRFDGGAPIEIMVVAAATVSLAVALTTLLREVCGVS